MAIFHCYVSSPEGKQMGIRAKLVDLVACDLVRTVLVLFPHRLSGQHGNLILQGSASIL